MNALTPRTAACSSCGRPVRWAITAKGRRMPVDPDPVANRNIDLTYSDGLAAAPIATYIVGERGQGPLYVSHFATCPNAAAHRRAK